MEAGLEVKTGIDIDREEVEKILQHMKDENRGLDTFFQLRLEWVGMEDERPIVKHILKVYGEDEEGNEIDKSIIL